MARCECNCGCEAPTRSKTDGIPHCKECKKAAYWEQRAEQRAKKQRAKEGK